MNIKFHVPAALLRRKRSRNEMGRRVGGSQSQSDTDGRGRN